MFGLSYIVSLRVSWWFQTRADKSGTDLLETTTKQSEAARKTNRELRLVRDSSRGKQELQLQSFVLSEEPSDLGIDLLLLSKIRKLVTLLDQLLDLRLDDLLLCLRFLFFGDVILVVHSRRVDRKS